MMGRMKDMLRMLVKDLSVMQKLNYVKYSLSSRGEILGYDPITISIVATSSCTLRCDMCPTHSPRVPHDYVHAQTNSKDIDFNMFKEIIDRFSNALNVQIIGSGEPMLNRDFFRMVEYAAGRKMAVKTFSNGTTIEQNIDNILNSKLDGITISINGHNAQEFDRMTDMGEAIYHKIYDAIRKLVKERGRRGSNIKIKLSFILDRHNYKFIPSMVETSQALGVDQTFFCNFLSCPVGGLTSEERSLMASAGLKKEILSLMAGFPASVRRKFALPLLIDTKMRANLCESHFSQIRFDGDGNVSSCSMMLLNMEKNGNFCDKNLWNNAFFRKMRAIFMANDDALLPEPCRVCPDNKGVCCNI